MEVHWPVLGRERQDCVSKVRTVAGWHDKGEIETYTGREGTVAGSNSESGMQLTFSCGETTPSVTQRSNQLADLG